MGRERWKEKEGWSGPHPALSLPLLTHLSISLHQPAPCVSSSPVEKKERQNMGTLNSAAATAPERGGPDKPAEAGGARATGRKKQRSRLR